LEGDCAAVSKCALAEKQKSAAAILGVASILELNQCTI
jgi:hypothetical protein